MLHTRTKRESKFLSHSLEHVNTLAAELFSEIKKSTTWSLIEGLTFIRGSCELNFASNIFKLYTIRCRISRRFQICNKKAKNFKNLCIESYGHFKLPRYFDHSTTSIIVVGSEWVNSTILNKFNNLVL